MKGERDPGLDRVDEQTERQVSGDKQLERGAAIEPALMADEHQGERDHERRLIQCRRVPANSVSEIYAPWQSRLHSIGAVRQSAQETTDAADRKTNRERQSKQIARRFREALPLL